MITDATRTKVYQDIVLDVLQSSATKRDARSYLSRYSPGKSKPTPSSPQQQVTNPGVGVNLGSLYPAIRSVEESPVFAQTVTNIALSDRGAEPLHVALVKITIPQSLGNDILEGVGHTLSQLTLLGLGCVVVVDSRTSSTGQVLHNVKTASKQADRLVAAIDGYGGQGARRVDSVLQKAPSIQHSTTSTKVRGNLRVVNKDLILAPLRRGLIPIIATMACAEDTMILEQVTANEVMLALTRDFAGINIAPYEEADPGRTAETVIGLQSQVSLDRMIILDPVGGIPSTDRFRSAHIFINLEQEYERIREDLLNSAASSPASHETLGTLDLTKTFTSSNPSSKYVSTDIATMPFGEQQSVDLPIPDPRPQDIKSHLENLDLLQNALGLLPPSSSGLITTLEEAANIKSTASSPLESLGVRTRPRRNPLIHNLLTDKPVLSPSLPVLSGNLPSQLMPHSTPATFLKRGMPVTIIPDPRTHPWKPPTASSPTLKLSDPRLDLARLVHLIEDSFNRALDVPHYLSRIENRIAGIIICGEYEGGAILTWEAPRPDSPPERLVPYLDKFAVLKRSQGAGGVADIVFKAMVRDCFPEGVCWRSRKDNPVNKWYFERAKGTWKIPAENWTMFWTTEGVEVGRDGGVFRDYEAVCKNVKPSWADKKAVVD